MRRALAILAALALTLQPDLSSAQAIATPNAHWGANMLPDLRHRIDWGLHFIGFTQYGKEVFPDTEDYIFTPYNDIGETLGFNMLVFSHTDDGGRRPFSRSSVQIRTTRVVGLINDRVPQFLQNDFAHWANWRPERLRRVPRALDDTPDSTSLGTNSRLPILGYTREYFIRFDQRRRDNGLEYTAPSPFFVGGGFSVGTVNEEMFLHVGTNSVEWRPSSPRCLPKAVLCFRQLGIAGMARFGVLFTTSWTHFQDLTSDFSSTQAVGDVELLAFGYPIGLSASITGHRGFFVETRRPEDYVYIAEDPTRDSLTVFDVKRPKLERFLSLRLRVGGFSFEFLNDNVGGKDKGPSFGVNAVLETSDAAWALRQFTFLRRLLGVPAGDAHQQEEESPPVEPSRARSGDR